MTTNSTWAALRNPAFRKLWGAAVHLRNLCGRPRQRSDLDDERFYRLAAPYFAHVNSGITAFLSVHTARRCSRRQGRSSETGLHDQCLHGRRSLRSLCLVGRIFSILISSWVACFSSESGLPSTHRPGHRSCAKSSPTRSCPQQRPWAVYSSASRELSVHC